MFYAGHDITELVGAGKDLPPSAYFSTCSRIKPSAAAAGQLCPGAALPRGWMPAGGL
jgi:hypothetical protein